MFRYLAIAAIIPVLTILAMQPTAIIAQGQPGGGPPPRLDVLSAAAAIGITPQTVVLMGQQGLATSILNRCETAVSERSALDTARAGLRTAQSAYTGAVAGIQAAPSDEDAMTALHAASQALSTRQSAYAAACLALQAAVIPELPEPTLGRLIPMRRAAQDYPAVLCVKDRTDDEWATIRAALRAERRADRRGEVVDAEIALLLTSLRADVDVIAAQNRLTLYLASVESAFESFLQGR